jgi:hypothetical protein
VPEAVPAFRPPARKFVREEHVSLANYRRGWVGLGVVALIGLVAACKDAEQKGQPAVDPREAVFVDFAKRLDAYMKVREEVEDSIGDLDPTRSQAEIATRATALGQSLIARRAEAKPGDIFTPEIATILATLIKEEYSRRSEPVQETREDQQDELPDFTPTVNQVYPTTYPLATFPATLLPLLPPLPEKVEYRIVQNYLVLRDIEANLIIDFMPNAVPM